MAQYLRTPKHFDNDEIIHFAFSLAGYTPRPCSQICSHLFRLERSQLYAAMLQGATDKMLAAAEACYANDFGCSLRQLGLREMITENRYWDSGVRQDSHAFVSGV